MKNKLNIWLYLVIFSSVFMLFVLIGLLYSYYGYSESGFTGFGRFVELLANVLTFPSFFFIDNNSIGILVLVGYIFNLNFYSVLIYVFLKKLRRNR